VEGGEDMKGTSKVLLRIAIDKDVYDRLEDLRWFWDRTTSAFDSERVTINDAIEGCIKLTHESLERYLLGSKTCKDLMGE
jgi:hypothetical protein